MMSTLDTSWFVIGNMRCAGCMRGIEQRLNNIPGVEEARCNLSTKRVVVRHDPSISSNDIAAYLEDAGYDAFPFRVGGAFDAAKREEKKLLIAMAVAGFASANIMLLSVSVWAGGMDMEASTRELFHWLSAIIAIPAVGYAGQPFFQSAFGALRHGRMNMDVPIALAIIASLVMSVVQTMLGSLQVYFDAAVMLIFFLLLGRVLDHRMRGRATNSVENLMAMQQVNHQRLCSNEQLEEVAADVLCVGDVILLRGGERLAVDATCKQDLEMDLSVITGESLPEIIPAGKLIPAGAINQMAASHVVVASQLSDSTLSEIVTLMEQAEQKRSKSLTIADQAAAIYAPGVHLLAIICVLFNWQLIGLSLEESLMRGIAVLIVTCPCALGLAVPAVMVVAAGKLFKQGILLRSGDALERLSQTSTIVFDKTGTLSEARLEMSENLQAEALALAAGLATHSTHPLSKLLAKMDVKDVGFERVVEHAGQGVVGLRNDKEYRLGKPDFALLDAHGEGLVLSVDGVQLARFHFVDEAKDGALGVVQRLKKRGLQLVMLSGDRPERAEILGKSLGIQQVFGGLTPADKMAWLEGQQGTSMAMVGDGINDGPALRMAKVGIAPGHASDVAANAADIIYLNGQVSSVAIIYEVALQVRRLIMQNFGLAIGYNVIAVPLAFMGFVTPLIAAVAMSLSSVVVTMNSLRLDLPNWISSSSSSP